MSREETVALAELKNRLSEFIEDVERTGNRVLVTKHGHPAAVILSVEDLESLEETLAVLGNPALVAEIDEGRREVAAGRSTALTKSEALELVRRR